MKKGNRKPRNQPRVYDRVIIENCINAYVDAGNDIKGIWEYLGKLVARGDITQPYAKIKAYESMNVIKSSERFYKEILKNEKA